MHSAKDLLKKSNAELYLFAGLDILFIGWACATLVVKSVGLSEGKDLILRTGAFRKILQRILGQQIWSFKILKRKIRSAEVTLF